ncbi:MAG TPA: CoA transferase [Candidatus Binataceae bacterium]|nr:CoA transferase [Candidatus Binataceae bacterium]
MSLPLEGIRVIDFGQIYAAPYCTLQLAAMGAEIIKIEPPKTGEMLRLPNLPGGANYSFLMLNPNKKSVTLNLKHPDAREIVFKLLEGADVIVENYLDGVMESFGLGYDTIAARFPRIIYASGKGYGAGSRFAKLGSMDNTIQASSGFISVTGFPDHGVKTSATFIDMGTGSHLVSGILAALIHRGKTGKGQKIEVAMLDVAIPALTSILAPVLQGRKFKRLGNRHWGVCPTNIYPASDGEVLIMVLTEAHWRVFAKLMGHDELLTNPEYKDHGVRMNHADELDELIVAWTRPQRRDDIIRIVMEAGIPCAPVREVDEVVADPEVAARGTLIDSTFPKRGDVRVVGSPIKMSAITREETPQQRPPDLGEHTEEVLASIGISRERIAQLRAEGAI